MGSLGIIWYILGLYIGRMEKKMETTIMGNLGIICRVFGFWGFGVLGL